MKHSVNNSEYFASFKTDSKYDIAMITVPKKSLNISPEYQISKVKFAKQNPPHDQKIYVLGNAGGLQESPILSKGNTIDEYNPLESFFSNRDKYFIKYNAKTHNGQSGSPTFNESGECVGMHTFANGKTFKIPFSNKQICISSATYSINNKTIASFIEC